MSKISVKDARTIQKLRDKYGFMTIITAAVYLEIQQTKFEAEARTMEKIRKIRKIKPRYIYLKA